jgi:hypothetical protein
MLDLCKLILGAMIDLLRSRVALEAEILVLGQQITGGSPADPRIHGELLKLGADVGQTSVAKYMTRRRGPPSQGWKAFLRNHADGVAAMDLFVVPTILFRLLYIADHTTVRALSCRRRIDTC